MTIFLLLFARERKQPSRYIKFSGRSYHDFNEDEFCLDLEAADWTLFDQAMNPDTAWDIMYSILLKIVDSHCPVKDYHISKKRPAYITPEIVALSQDRDYHHRMASQSSINSDLVAYHYQLATSLKN